MLDNSRLSRHLVVNGWSCESQRFLDAFRIGIVGAGGLGSMIASMLCTSTCGPFECLLIDHDIVESSNLHRQVTYTESMAGKPKADCLRDVCKARNKSCNMRSIIGKITAANAVDILSDVDVIFDCTDNLDSRFAISDAWVQLGRRQVLISASCVGWSGKIVTLFPKATSCIRCLFSGVSDNAICEQSGQCAIQGVMGPVVGMIANMQLLELLNYVRQQKQDTPRLLHPRVRLVDMSSGTLWHYDYDLVPSCRVCALPSPVEQELTVNPIVAETNICVPEINKSDFRNLLSTNQNSCIIDVREPNHFKLARIRKSINFPASNDVSELVAYIDSLPIDSPIVIVCRRGINSAKVLSNLSTLVPHRRIVSLQHGLLGLGMSCFIYPLYVHFIYSIERRRFFFVTKYVTLCTSSFEGQNPNITLVVAMHVVPFEADNIKRKTFTNNNLPSQSVLLIESFLNTFRGCFHIGPRLVDSTDNCVHHFLAHIALYVRVRNHWLLHEVAEKRRDRNKAT